MRHTTTETQIEATPLTLQALNEIVREGARSLLQAALQAEVQEHLARYQNVVDENGRHVVVRNGSQPKRAILTGAGPVEVERPRVDDRMLAAAGKERFPSRILPKFMRRAPSIDEILSNVVGGNFRAFPRATVFRGVSEYQPRRDRSL